MPPLILALAVLVALPIIIAALLANAPGTLAQTWIRRIALVLLNLNPFSIGTWRREFSRRETFFAAWLLILVLELVGVLLFAKFSRSAHAGF